LKGHLSLFAILLIADLATQPLRQRWRDGSLVSRPRFCPERFPKSFS
jgi:hypothetical protein